MTEPEGCDPGEKYLQAKYLCRKNCIRCFTSLIGVYYLLLAQKKNPPRYYRRGSVFNIQFQEDLQQKLLRGILSRCRVPAKGR